MLPHESTIHKLCQDGLTRNKAKALFYLASQRTGRDTGHDLGAGHVALAQVCAFLASEATGAHEFTQEVAQSNSCVDAKTFEAAVQTVRRVTSGSYAAALGVKKVTYASLVRLYNVREDAGVAMLEVQDTLRKRGAFDDTPLELGSPAVQCAIFYWVSTKVFKLIGPDSTAYQSRYKISRGSWNLACRQLEAHCSHMLEHLTTLASTAISSTRTRNQTPKKSQTSTPGRKRRLATHSQDESEGESAAVIVVRPKKKFACPADTAAWEALRPKPADTHSTPTKESSSTNQALVLNDVEAMYNTPMTSTGMSDVFSDSPANGDTSRPPARTRFRLPPPAAVSSEDEEEMPRRRRRNLRAPFLDREAYSWTPNATLERGRKLEALMISKYGDPWDEL